MNQYYQFNPYRPINQSPSDTKRALTTNQSLYSAEEGFMKGNMFADTYRPYQNYQPQIIQATNDQERLFLALAENDFAAHDLNLYLDLHPQDGNMLDVFNQYRQKGNQLRMEYEQKYGPLLIFSNSLGQSPFLWESMLFPWNGGNG